MNSKKKLAVLGLVVLLFMVQNLTLAQSAQYSGGNVQVTLPTLRYINPPSQQFYTLFIETGDGKYIKSNRIENTDNIPLQSISYPNRININYGAVVNIIGHYDTFPPPFRQILVQPVSNPFPPNNNVQNKLISGTIRFDFSDTTLVPGDTTTMVLTYKTDRIKFGQDTADYILAFFYNDLEASTAGKIFSEITNPYVLYKFTSDVQNVRAVRMSNEEIPFSDIPSNLIPNDVSSSLRTAKGEYNNGLYFMIKHGAYPDEKNIFISLSPDKLNDLNYSGNSTNFQLVKIKYNKTSGTIGSPEIKSLTLPIRFLARDPNGISIFPSCIDTVRSKKLRSRISFQNDGPGVAANIKATMNIPTGMEFPPANFAAALHTSTQLVFFKFVPNIPSDDIPGNFYSFDIVHRQIDFAMNDINLQGTHPLPTVNEAQRKGEIVFDLKPIISPIDQCVNIDVSMTFVNKIDGIYLEGSHVKASASIKKNCKPGQKPCPRLTPGGE